MYYEIAANIPCYKTNSVGCFDPSKVMARIRDNVPGVIVCLHDHAWDRHETFSSHGLDAALETVANDARRRGPIYRCRINTGQSQQIIEGEAERYSVTIRSTQPIPEPLKSKILDALHSLTLDEIEVTSVRQDGNSSEPT